MNYYALINNTVLVKVVKDPVEAGKSLATGECNSITTLHSEDELAAFLAEIKQPVKETDPIDELTEFWNNFRSSLETASTKFLKQVRSDHQDLKVRVKESFDRAKTAGDDTLRELRGIVAKALKKDNEE